MKAIVALFALVLVAALGAMAAGSIADAVATWSDAQVQIAQIDANVKMYQIGIDAVQRANDRAAAWFLIGALTVVGALALPWLLRNFEDEGDYHARQDRLRSSARNSLAIHNNQRQLTATQPDWYNVDGATFDDVPANWDITPRKTQLWEDYR